MGNPHRGEVAFEVDGKNYNLRYSANAICEMEDALKMSVNSIVKKMQDPDGMSIGIARTIFWAGLTDRHPDIDVKAAGALIDGLGISGATEMIGKAFTLAFGEGGKAGTKDARPPRNGTGRAS